MRKDSTAFIPPAPSLISKLKRALRGEVDARTVALEAWRRSGVSLQRRRERAALAELDARPADLSQKFAKLSPPDLLQHFRQRREPRFFSGFAHPTEAGADLQKTYFPSDTARLIEQAARICESHRWTLLGYGELDFGPEIEWRRDLVSGEVWPADYHLDIELAREGADVRVLWELNRLAHLITLGRAYAVNGHEPLAEEFFRQLDGWRKANPVGRGPNWACAMEVALRAMNLLAAFELFRRSESLTTERLLQLLAMFDAHGAHIRRNLEFSYIATSNHYLSDVTGLLWLGLMLPELKAAREWREFALGELLREMDKQILEDGADDEASTGYHRLVLELFFYSFLLCRANGLDIPERAWDKLRAMLYYLRAYLRPDGRAPLIGDTDSGQVLPLVHRAADDHAYLLALGAVVFQEPLFKLAGGTAAMPEELLWMLGSEGVKRYEALEVGPRCVGSVGFADAGTYLMREDDLYLLFNASGCGVGGRGSHGHNDALSLEVAACGASFITDPGTYVYRTSLKERGLFRSTAYHSTVEVDGAEQNTTIENLPFVIGDEAHPRVLVWETGEARDRILAEHQGYRRLPEPITHRRAVEFNKRDRFWMIEDMLSGTGEHIFRFRFHLTPGIAAAVRADRGVEARDKINGARLFIVPLGAAPGILPELEPRFTSRDYGAKMPSVSVCWTVRAEVPVTSRWALLPVCATEDEGERLGVIEELRSWSF